MNPFWAGFVKQAQTVANVATPTVDAPGGSGAASPSPPAPVANVATPKPPAAEPDLGVARAQPPIPISGAN